MEGVDRLELSENALREMRGRFLTARAYFANIPKNTEFVPRAHIRPLSQLLHLNIETVRHILYHPPIRMFEDVAERIRLIGASGGLPVVWTQGSVGTFDIRRERHDPEIIGFQPLKVVASGLDAVLKQYADTLEDLGLSSVMGGRDKNHASIVDSVLACAKQYGIRDIVAVDDLESNLNTLRNYCGASACKLHPYWMNRFGDVFPRGSPHLFRARSLGEVSIIPGALYLLDLDRTLVDTDTMKLVMCSQLAQASFN